MADPSVTSADVRGRARAYQLAPTEPQEALRTARAIRHPWYRCQALSTVAKHWGTKPQKRKLLGEALAAAQEQQEINRVVTVSAWPVRVLTEVAPDDVTPHVQRLVTLANDEPHPVRRADALSALVSAVRDHPSLPSTVVPSLVAALLAGRGWRIDRLIRNYLEIVRRFMPEVVDTLIEHHGEGRPKRAFVKAISDGRHKDLAHHVV